MQSFFAGKMAVERAEGFQRAIGKPFGRLRRGETLCNMGKVSKALSLAFHKESVSCGRFRPLTKGWAPEGVQGAIGKPPGRLRRGETLCKTEKARKLFFLASHKKSVSCERFRPPAGGRGTFPARESTQRAPGAAKGCMEHGRPRTPRC